MRSGLISLKVTLEAVRAKISIREGKRRRANAARQAARVTAQNGSYRQFSGNWPCASTQADPSMQACDAPTLCNTCAIVVFMRLDFLSVRRTGTLELKLLVLMLTPARQK